MRYQLIRVICVNKEESEGKVKGERVLRDMLVT